VDRKILETNIILLSYFTVKQSVLILSDKHMSLPPAVLRRAYGLSE